MDTKASFLRGLQLCPTWPFVAGGFGDKLWPAVSSPTQRGTRDSPGWRTDKDGVYLEGPKSKLGRVDCQWHHHELMECRRGAFLSVSKCVIGCCGHVQGGTTCSQDKLTQNLCPPSHASIPWSLHSWKRQYRLPHVSSLSPLTLTNWRAESGS